jgi:hypothetical protein
MPSFFNIVFAADTSQDALGELLLIHGENLL